VALAAATITKTNRRHGTKYIAQLTRKDTYVEDDVTYGVADEDVLEVANQQAREAVAQRLGPVDEDHWAVIDLTPYFLLPPGDDATEKRWDNVFSKLTPQVASSASTAVDPDDDSEDDRRRYSGDDFEDDANVQNLGRPRRSAF
jgi:hypothetical protein